MSFDSQNLDPFSRELLEFPAIIELLRPLLSGPISQRALDQIAPRADLAAIQSDLELAREACDYLRVTPRPGWGSLIDPLPILEKLRIAGVACSALEILGVVEAAKAACHARDLFVETPCEKLNELARSAPDLRNLVRDLDGKILPDGSIDSSASPALARIRRSIERTQQELHSALERLLRRLAREQALQDELITVRNGRYVLPVRAEKRRQVEGILHGSSSSGASLYVEPLETLPFNNELVELQDREEAEIRRILAEFSEKLRERREELLKATAVLGALDLAFAKAEFARRYEATIPQFSAGRELALEEARHPLLEKALRAAGRRPVPLNVELREPQTLMVISGPNTGGKTVALKTIGAAVLMAQAGLPVPAKEARLPVFTRVLADIGDQQSIEQNLSTFSAHIRNIQAMIEVAGSADMVLLDEIGSSTDPEEGAALAVAILEYFRKRGSMTFVTTHHSRLKAYAAEAPATVNAAMDFDEATLQPTYRLLTGLPGKSSGLDIAQRIGLNPEIIQQARSLLGPAEKEASSLIAWLHAKRAETETELAHLRAQAQAMEESELQRKQQWAAERQAKLRELDKRLEETLREYDREWKKAMEEIRAQAMAEAKSARALSRMERRGSALSREARDEWNLQVLETLGPPAEVEPEGDNKAPVAVGDRVRLKSFSTPGVVTAILGEGQLEVEVGRLRMRVQREDVRAVIQREAASTYAGASPVRAQSEEAEAPAEINVIGSAAEEARAQVDKFLDDAYLAGRFKLRVVHGHGHGVLKRSLHEMFAAHPHVEKFYPAPRNEGGEGATIVEIKR
ncbi:MAG TPA: endonuclease MutS2 [Terriglobia bacterium]|nr:endonuclease MutS2 [Terriglobia bacterium]